MKLKLLAASAIAVLFLALSASAEASKEAVVPVGPPQPRVVKTAKPQALPPRATDPAWILYQEGVRLYGEKRFGEALDSFRKSIESRSATFERASEDIASAVASKEAGKAKGSLSALLESLALRDIIPQDLEAIRGRAKGSIVAELGLMRELSPSSPLRGLIDATLLVVEERGLARIGDSLAALAKAAASLAYYPEAEFWMGKIYLAEGETRLAELQMRRAYEFRESLEVSDDRFAMLESIAAIYKTSGDLKEYEATLREIADASDLFAVKDEFYRNAMERTLARQGFDKFMSLYRIDEKVAIGAYSSLGALYLEAKRPLAVIYLAAATNAVLTRAIAAIRVDSPSYSYAGLRDLASRIQSDRDISRFADESGLWRDLVYLGEALAATGDRESARELWAAVAGAPGPIPPWGRRAADLTATLAGR